MIIDKGGRSSGKSTRAAMWAAGDAENRIVVTFSEASAAYVRGIGQRMGLNIEVTTFRAYLDGRLRGKRNVQIYIDELTLCLASLGGEVAGVSL